MGSVKKTNYTLSIESSKIGPHSHVLSLLYELGSFETHQEVSAKVLIQKKLSTKPSRGS